MDNRDYFTRPTQSGGRTVHDYGHTKLGPQEPPVDMPWWAAALGGALFAAAIILQFPGVGA